MEQHYPLTKQQEGLWIEWRLHPDNTSYNTCVKLRMTGDLDKVRFENALRDVVQFFSSLRVYFVEEGGLPFQRVKQEGEFSLEFEDLSLKQLEIETPEQKNKAREFLERMLRTPVDLKSFPIVRAGLAKSDTQCSLLYWPCPPYDFGRSISNFVSRGNVNCLQ